MSYEKEYLKSEFKKVSTVYSEFKTKLKLIKPDGETKWLDITEEQLEQIKSILLDSKRCYICIEIYGIYGNEIEVGNF